MDFKNFPVDNGNRLDGELNTTNLVIVGADIKGQVNICTLNALTIGSEVYLLNDITAPRDTAHRETFIARLTQAGVVLSTV